MKFFFSLIIFKSSTFLGSRKSIPTEHICIGISHDNTICLCWVRELFHFMLMFLLVFDEIWNWVWNLLWIVLEFYWSQKVCIGKLCRAELKRAKTREQGSPSAPEEINKNWRTKKDYVQLFQYFSSCIFLIPVKLTSGISYWRTILYYVQPQKVHS